MEKIKYSDHYLFVDDYKTCCKCGFSKHRNDYSKDVQKKSGYRPDCKECNSKRQRQLYTPEKKLKGDLYKKANPEKIRAYKVKERIKNAVRYKKYQQLRYLLNKEEISTKKKAYYNKNKSEIHKKLVERYHTDIEYKLKMNLRRRMHKLIKRNERKGSALRDLGCSLSEFKIYLESKFQEGMTWDNYGKWHLDHIIPLSLVVLQDEKTFKTVAHYTNYQPLWAKDNIVKSDKICYNVDMSNIKFKDESLDKIIPEYKKELKHG